MPSFPDVICFSHLRWGFVFQRPNHLMARMARDRRVFFFEEPVFAEGNPLLTETNTVPGVIVVTPRVPEGLEPRVVDAILRNLLRDLFVRYAIERPLLWFYTPMMVTLAEGIEGSGVVYDCMDDLTGFVGAPPELTDRETVLVDLADVVFTGGTSLCEAKRAQGVVDAHAFPSSVDVAHFAAARGPLEEPADQAAIPGPRIGWFGVIDERLDVALLDRLAAERPDHQLVMIGPVVKIDPATLPRRPNIHWLGQKDYAELPSYIAGWQVAIMPFALNRATRFISPTKTLEYLAAGVPVVSTAIQDVANPYGKNGSVILADRESFPVAVDAALHVDRAAFIARADAVLASTSWDATFDAMMRLVVATTLPRLVDDDDDPTIDKARNDQEQGRVATCSTI